MGLPYVATAKMELGISVPSLFHRMHFPTNFTFVGGNPLLISHTSGLYTVNPQTWVDAIWSTLKAVYNTAIGAPTWILFETSGTTFIPIASGIASGGAGTNVHATQYAGQLSMTFKDVSNKRLNLYAMEPAFAVPDKSTQSGFANAMGTFMAQCLPPAGAGSIWDSLVSRSGNAVARQLAWTLDLNSRLTRERHVA